MISKWKVLFPHSHVGTGDTSDCTTITIPVPQHKALDAEHLLPTCRQQQPSPPHQHLQQHSADSQKHYLKVPQIVYGRGSRSGSHDQQRKCGSFFQANSEFVG